MSLGKRYYLRCDSRYVLIDREIADGAVAGQLEVTRPKRQEITKDCEVLGPDEWTAKDARAKGRKAGWVRHREGGSVVDLCPKCAPKLVQS